MATETQENEASSLGDEWQWINNETAEVLRATVENAFFADPRKNWSAEELARWIRDVGLVSAKKNVWDHAAALGEFLVNGLGYVTGEDYMSMDLALMFTIAEDEAVAQMMNDASLRTVHRYMVGINCWSAATGQPVSTAPAEGAGAAASPGSATSGRTATEQALLKVAEAATVKLPTWKSSTAMSVKQVKAHIKSYAAGKRSTWNTDKLDEAVMDMRKNAQRSAAENRAEARDILARGADGTDLDFREAPEFLQSLPGHIKTAARINQSQTVTEAVSRLLAKAAKRPWEELRCELHKCFEKTKAVESAKTLKEKFTTFNDDLGELRFSDFVTAEMVCETLQNVLAKFQPLCHKVVAAESKATEEQEKISAMIAVVWDEMPKLISKQELMDMDSGGSPYSSSSGKGRGAGKGAGKGGK